MSMHRQQALYIKKDQTMYLTSSLHYKIDHMKIHTISWVLLQDHIGLAHSTRSVDITQLSEQFTTMRPCHNKITLHDICVKISTRCSREFGHIVGHHWRQDGQAQVSINFHYY